MVCVGRGITINRLVGAAACCVCGLVSGRGGRGGMVWGWHCWCWGELRVRAVRSSRSLAGCGAEVRVGGGRMGLRAGLWSVGNW